MYEIVLTIHHYLAFVALALLAWATLNGIMGTTSDKIFTESHRKINVFALISVHTMLLLGLILLAVSPGAAAAFADMKVTMKDSVLRKWYVEHPTVNIIAAVLVTVGNVMAKKATTNAKKFKFTMIFFGLALLLIVSRVPWEKVF